jgi:hypothetical protein
LPKVIIYGNDITELVVRPDEGEGLRRMDVRAVGPRNEGNMTANSDGSRGGAR